MQIDSSKIKGTRFMFAIAFFLQSSVLLTSFISGITERESWIPIISGVLIFIPFVFVYKTIMTDYPDKNLVQVLKLVFGNFLGIVISLSYIVFFLTLTALNLSDLGSFAKITVMFQTPKTILLLMCVLVSVFAIRHGLSVVTRYSGFFTVMEFILIATILLMVMNLIEIDNFLPIFNLESIKYIHSTHIIATIPFGELVVFLMITPNLDAKKKKIIKYWLWGVAMGAITFLIVLLRDIAVLGNALHLFTLPGLMTLRLVSLGATLSRMEILFAVLMIILLFFKVVFLLYVSNIAIAQTFNLKNYRHLALIVGIFVIAFSFTIYPNAIIHTKSARETTPVIWTFFEFIIPVLALIIGRVRKLNLKENKLKSKNQKENKKLVPMIKKEIKNKTTKGQQSEG